ncbi:MAG: ABC transporter permease [Myxococcales bacterium]|nr:ABC transporter permease [Myxococcales bacterium]MCB9707439.1 ABC transporter permease [Myxococcales bacterium]
MTGLVIVIVFFVVAIVGPSLAPYSPEHIDLRAEFAPASFRHWLGTTENGVDVLSALLHGARLAAVVSVCVVALSLVIGTLLGITAGYLGRRADHIVSALADLVQAFPAIILNIGIIALVSRAGLVHLIVALVITGWVLYTRLARAEALSLRERDFIIAARALGATGPRIVVRHLLPNLVPPLLIQATTGMGGAILAESTLSFLGLGPGKSTSWGALLDQGSAVLLRFPHVALAAGSVIAITVLGFNLTGDFLRDYLDPQRG